MDWNEFIGGKSEGFTGRKQLFLARLNENVWLVFENQRQNQNTNDIITKVMVCVCV